MQCKESLWNNEKAGFASHSAEVFCSKNNGRRHRLGYSPILLLDAESPIQINQIWLGDITYIPLESGVFCYLALVMDLYSRRIIGWSLKADMTESLVLAAVRMAINERQPSAGLIHHTDRGGQYVGIEYRSVLHRSEIRDNMSHADNCYDNAFMESGIGTIKNELEMTGDVCEDPVERGRGPRSPPSLLPEACPVRPVAHLTVENKRVKKSSDKL